ncbi:MAG: YggS family pyridoxal phosphate-dependent enzyme, partial [Gammaproteobacteria bacterium]
MTGATLESIARNLEAVRARMAAAAVRAGRDPAVIRLLAVSKTWPAAAIEAACETGQTDYGENYLQEALPKLEALGYRRELVWHFIGALQANKTRPVAERFAWVHTLDRQRIAQRLDAQRPVTLPPLNVCIEVRLDPEPGKGGVEPPQLAALANYIASLPHLRLRGLMG